MDFCQLVSSIVRQMLLRHGPHHDYRVFASQNRLIKQFELRVQETLHRLVRLSGLSPVPCVSRAASFMATGPQCINLQIDFYFAAALRSHPCTQRCQAGRRGTAPGDWGWGRSWKLKELQELKELKEHNACGFLIEIGDCAWAVFAVGDGNLTMSRYATRQFNTHQKCPTAGRKCVGSAVCGGIPLSTAKWQVTSVRATRN